MFRTAVRLAESGRVPLSLSQASAELLPPIPLYRRLLRAHRSLPAEMRFMGDAYVKSEFHATKGTDNPLHIMAFLGQWKMYLDQIEAQLNEGKPFDGRKLDPEIMNSLNNEQVGQLYELMHSTDDLWKTPEELEAAAAEAEAADAAERAAEEKK
ncbi:carbon utilization by utilization of organic compounds-related protein [Trichosporon asahii var. asahii CBS 8904]|uniref:Succinate dehydrogenase assembly factor 3 n=1 Tax=Trichosporon asahii var. asahii (strain CBS 8904) TaxID=1220162 RepID=K1WNU7_TRIAC|nr:carbon utilization by utilization of organic compounds-related protein [Trichosporon asahii var. asahii CBS 8904]